MPLPSSYYIERREVRPTADRGPILVCVDTSGSMRGARETVAKALTLECMRAAREQERDCYVYAFAGPTEVGVRRCYNMSVSRRLNRTGNDAWSSHQDGGLGNDTTSASALSAHPPLRRCGSCSSAWICQA